MTKNLEQTQADDVHLLMGASIGQQYRLPGSRVIGAVAGLEDLKRGATGKGVLPDGLVTVV